MNFTVTAVARTAKPDLPQIPNGAGMPTPKEQRKVWFIGGPETVPVYDRATLRGGTDGDGAGADRGGGVGDGAGGGAPGCARIRTGIC